MRNKAPLALMEQMVMILVFALAAALCLQAFVQSDELSGESEARDRAVLLCQTVAESIKAEHGDLSTAAQELGITYGAYAQEEPEFSVHYNEDWTISHTREYAYVLTVREEASDDPALGKAMVTVRSAPDGTEIFGLKIAWQREVSAHG